MEKPTHASVVIPFQINGPLTRRLAQLFASISYDMLAMRKIQIHILREIKDAESYLMSLEPFFQKIVHDRGPFDLWSEIEKRIQYSVLKKSAADVSFRTHIALLSSLASAHLSLVFQPWTEAMQRLSDTQSAETKTKVESEIAQAIDKIRLTKDPNEL